MQPEQAIPWSRQDNDAVAVLISVVLACIYSFGLPPGWQTQVYLPALAVSISIILGLGCWLICYLAVKS